MKIGLIKTVFWRPPNHVTPVSRVIATGQSRHASPNFGAVGLEQKAVDQARKEGFDTLPGRVLASMDRHVEVVVQPSVRRLTARSIMEARLLPSAPA